MFISSTQKDLQPERNGAEAVIAELGHACLRAETYDSPGISPQGACREMATGCDIYIGIFGSRYGFRIPDLGVSVTEMEYRVARGANPAKVFIYVKEEAAVEDEQQRFLAEVQDFAAGYFRHERFVDSGRLAEQIRRDVITWTTRQVRQALAKEIEIKALRDKVEHLSRVMELYGVPEGLR